MVQRHMGKVNCAKQSATMFCRSRGHVRQMDRGQVVRDTQQTSDLKALLKHFVLKRHRMQRTSSPMPERGLKLGAS